MTNNTINVPRELLGRIIMSIHMYWPDAPLIKELRALLSAPSPAGVDADHVEDVRAMVAAPSPAGVGGLEVMSNWVLFDAEADKPYIKKMLPDGFLAFFDCEGDARRAKANNPGTDYKRIDRVKAEDAQATIDGLRGEVGAQRIKTCTALKERNDAREERDRQAQRIGELEGLLRSCLPALSDGGCAALANRIDAALAADKEASK